MKNEKFKWLVAIGGTLFFAVAMTLDALTSDFTNVTVNNFHFKSVSKYTGGRGSLNYDLYVQDSNKSYKIGADYAGCFYYDNFINNVKPGATVTLSVLKSNGIMRNSDLLQVVDIESNGYSYLSSGCVVNSVDDKKNLIPIAWAALFGLSVFYYFRIVRKKANPKDTHRTS